MRRNKRDLLQIWQNENNRRQVRLKIMGLGGLSKAAKEIGVSYWRLSRVINGWLQPTKAELEKIEKYIS